MKAVLALLVLASPPDLDGAKVGERIRVTTPELVIDGTLTSADEGGIRLSAGGEDVLVPAGAVVSVKVVRLAASPALPAPVPPTLTIPPLPPPPRIPVRSAKSYSSPVGVFLLDLAWTGPFSASGTDRAWYPANGGPEMDQPISGTFGDSGMLRFAVGRAPGRSDIGDNGFLWALGMGEGLGSFQYAGGLSGTDTVLFLQAFLRAGWFATVTSSSAKLRLHPYLALEGSLGIPYFTDKSQASGDPYPQFRPAGITTASVRVGAILGERFDLAASIPFTVSDLGGSASTWKQGFSVELGLVMGLPRKRP